MLTEKIGFKGVSRKGGFASKKFKILRIKLLVFVYFLSSSSNRSTEAFFSAMLSSIFIEFDANSKVGKDIIPGDPCEKATENGVKVYGIPNFWT